MEPELKLYTIADLRAWLIDNNPPAGLTEQVIAPVRAYAILNNPYVRDDDAVVAAIYEGDELAAFTACFPELITSSLIHSSAHSLIHSSTHSLTHSTRIWWCTTLWCNPKFQGKGYGMVVVGSLMEAHEEDVFCDRWGAQETVEICNSLGMHTIYTPRYILGDKVINRSTLRGKLAYLCQFITKVIHSSTHSLTHSLIHSTIYPQSYTLKYATFIDGEAYAFIQSHRGNDMFLREQTMLNWILRYPFMQSCAVLDRIEKDTEFSANVPLYSYSVVKVYQDKALVGVYILRRNAERLSVIYVYFCEDDKEPVFASIVEHIIQLKTSAFETEDKDLADYVRQRIYFPKKTIERVSFSYPANSLIHSSTHPSTPSLTHSFTQSFTPTFQFGDGDNFV